MGLTLGALLGSKSEAAVALFLSIRNARAQKEAVSAAANVSISGEHLDALEAVLSLYSSIGKQRHELAHGIFGFSDELPDAVLWIESQKMSHFLIESYHKEKNNIQTSDPHGRLKSNLFVYRRKDLLESLDYLNQLWWATFYIMCATKDGFSIAPESRKLLEMPLVAKEISRIQQGRKNSPEAQT